jgi:hypothetical protein
MCADLRTLLAACLAVCVALPSTLQLAHLATADHGHSYCDEHHQFEDVPRRALVAQEDQPVDASGSPTAKRLPGSQSLIHVACSCLNCSSLQAPFPGPAQAPAAVPSRPTVTPAGSQQAAFAVCPLLLSAPKTSPPFPVV